MTTDELKRHQDNLAAYSHWVKDPDNNIVDIEWKSNETSLSRWEGCRKGHVPLWNFNRWDYRLKPQPRVIPWTMETCPVGKVVKGGGWRFVINAADQDGCCLGMGDKSTKHDYDRMLSVFTMDDGSPCGVEEVRE